MKHNPRLRKFLLLGVGFILAYICLEIIFIVTVGPSATELLLNFWEIQQSKKAFSEAKLRWESRGSSNYQITVNNLNFRVNNLYACSQIKDTLTVKDKNVIDSSALPLETCQPVYEQLTVEAVFDRVERELATVDLFTTEMEVEFDPEFGFVSSYSVRKYSPFSFIVYSEHPTVLTFSNFRAMDK